jgi:5-methylcytosine-specific restriction endonuclease McrA
MMRQCLGTAAGRCSRFITKGSRCPDCRRGKERERQRTRDPLPVRVYASTEWRRLARAVVDGADRCAWCGTSAALVKLTADHIYPVRERPDLAIEPSNVVAACRGCQERRKQRPDPRTWAEWERRPRW